MVSNVSMGRNGIAYYLVQRATALILLAYVLFLTGFLLFGGEVDYLAWRGLFSHTAMRTFTLLALIALCLHAWAGMWTVYTDYFTPRLMGRGGTATRMIAELLTLIVLFAYLAWGVQILWSM